MNETLIKDDQEIILDEPIRINIELPEGELMIIKSFNIKITNLVTISELLAQALDHFNETFSNSGLSYQLSKDLKNYHVRPSKKNGKPDLDLPSNVF